MVNNLTSLKLRSLLQSHQKTHGGHPLLGDGKYGKLDKRFDRSYQALYSYKLTFTFTTDAGALEHLNGRSFQVENVDFVKEYFPD